MQLILIFTDQKNKIEYFTSFFYFDLLFPELLKAFFLFAVPRSFIDYLTFTPPQSSRISQNKVT